jgi:mono/diheme cytochrome c family protein
MILLHSFIIIVAGVTMGLAGGSVLGIGQAADQVPPVLGQELYPRLACHGCHTLQGQGGKVGPRLDGVGSRLSDEELAMQLSTPHCRGNDSRMPSFAFVRPFELQKLLDFLQTLK